MQSSGKLKLGIVLLFAIVFTGLTFANFEISDVRLALAAPAAPTATPTPAIPPQGLIPLVTSRTLTGAPIPNRINGGSPIPMGTATPVETIWGDATRHDYMVWVDSTSTATKFRCTWGDVYNGAPTNEPTTTLGAELTSTQPFYNEITPGARMDCISESGAGVLDTSEE